jgi:hypothetical protein
MNKKIEDLMYHAGLTAAGCWDTMDAYDRAAIEKFAELIVAECIFTIQMGITRDGPNTEKYLRSIKHITQIKEHFGVQE